MPLVEMTAIIPDRPFDPDAFEREIRRVLEIEVREIERLYWRVTYTWNTKPKMATDIVMSGADAYGEVYTADDSEGNKHLVWLDDGTPGKTFGPKTRPYLVYRKNFRAKTRRGSVVSSHGGKYGDFTRRKQVDWPGVSARDFSKTIAKIREKRFQENVERAFDRAVRNF